MRRTWIPIATSALFSGSYVAGKYTTLDLGPLTTTALRYGIALAFLACLLPHYGTRSLRFAGRDVPRAMLMGLSGIVGYHYFFFSSLRHTEVANTAIINALSPVLTGLLAALLIRERLSASNYAGIGLATIGVVLLLCDGEPARLLIHDFNRGDLLMLLSVLCWAAYGLLVKSLSGRYSGYTLTFYATLFGVVLLGFMVPAEDPVAQLQAASRISLYSVLYMGVFASGLGYLLYNLSIHSLGPTRTSGFVYSTVPLFVAGLAFMLFAQAITGVMMVSAALILAGLHLMLRERPVAEAEER